MKKTPIQKKKIRCNILGDLIEHMIPRFIKEKTRYPSINPINHMLQWFRLNKDLIFETDKTVI
jgi:hypothetical protein